MPNGISIGSVIVAGLTNVTTDAHRPTKLLRVWQQAAIARCDAA